MIDLSPTVLSLLAGGALFILVFVIGSFYTQRQTRQARLKDVIGTVKVDAGPEKTETKRRSTNDSVTRRLKDLEKKAQNTNDKRTLKQRLQEAGLPPSHTYFFWLSVGTSVFFLALAYLFGFSPISFVFTFVFAAVGAPRLVIVFLAGRRRKAVLDDLSDALEAVVRSIKAGLPVAEAMGAIAKDFSGPLADEFSIAVDEQKMGLSVGESLERCAERMPLPEMRMLAMAVSIQLQTGGSLAETLTNMANVIRSREALARKVKAVSSEAKISAMIMGALPMFVMGSLWAINPDYVGILFTDTVGQILLVGCGGWMMIGVFIMWQMVNFKV